MAGYAAVGTAFDRLAPGYEAIVETNPLHARMRERSLAWLDEAFGPGMHVLEAGCGTGTEAVHLARRGVRVTATDVSPRMVDLARARVRTEGLEDLVAVRALAAGDLGDALRGASFDGAYSSFGALNCEPDLLRTLEGIARLLRPGAAFVASVVSRPCATELLAASLRLDLRRAFRRLRGDTGIGLYGLAEVRARAYSEGELLRSLAPRFVVERIEGWLVALPPPYLSRTWARLGPLRRPFDALDGRLAVAWPFRAWGDHLHVFARRRTP